MSVVWRLVGAAALPVGWDNEVPRQRKIGKVDREQIALDLESNPPWAFLSSLLWRFECFSCSSGIYLNETMLVLYTQGDLALLVHIRLNTVQKSIGFFFCFFFLLSSNSFILQLWVFALESLVSLIWLLLLTRKQFFTFSVSSQFVLIVLVAQSTACKVTPTQLQIPAMSLVRCVISSNLKNNPCTRSSFYRNWAYKPPLGYRFVMKMETELSTQTI